jgi:peptidyl-prolyl cis-trans isomerase B (cyclophilin B)
MEQAERTKWIALGAFALVAAVIVGAILIARGGGSSATVAGCKQVAAPQPKHVSFKAPPQKVTRSEKLTADVATSCGRFEIALDNRQAPKIVNSFVFLTDEGFYDGLDFHRVVPGFVIQGGDPLGNGTGGPGYSVVEKPPANLTYTKGTVAMAKGSSDPSGSAGSQFFVVLAPNAGLPAEYALVGKVSSGMGVVERIGELGDSETEKPSQTVLIEKMTIEKG